MIKRTIQIKLTPAETAFSFCNMDADEQAAFFNEIGVITKQWDKPFALQLESLSQTETLNQEGRFIMGAIGGYSRHKRK